MKKQMEILCPDETVVRKIKQKTGCHPIIAKILANRGLTSIKSVVEFFNPSLGFIHSFNTLMDMDKAVERICRAILDKEKIMVFGDYDVDGITSTVLVYEFLIAAGADVTYYIPHRIAEGYGLNLTQIETIIRPGGFSLVVTIDCGSASHDAINRANESGIDIIVTDHHAIGNSIPQATAVVNPRRNDCPSGSNYLAGVGVAFCLLISLRKHLREINFWQNRPEPNLKDYCDLVALGTIADVVPLIHENRIMTRAGLDVITKNPRPGLAALIKLSGIQPSTVDAGDIAFKLSPRLNAAGRMDHARLAVELLTANDIDEAYTLAARLNKMNTHRQEVEQTILNHILMFFNDAPEQLNKSAIILGKKDWHEGVLGIVASKLTERFCKPVILLSFNDKKGKGSGRSVPGINLYDALCECKELLEGFGGHPMAAGLTIAKENFKPFQKKFNQTISRMTGSKKPVANVFVDCRIDFAMISDRLIDEIAMLQPFGQDNPEPLFCANNVDVAFSKILGNKHLRLTLRQRGHGSAGNLNAIWFNVDREKLDKTHFETIVFKLRWNHWNGRKRIQAIIENL